MLRAAGGPGSAATLPKHADTPICDATDAGQNGWETCSVPLAARRNDPDPGLVMRGDVVEAAEGRRGMRVGGK